MVPIGSHITSSKENQFRIHGKEILKFLTYISSHFPIELCCLAILRGNSFSEKFFEMISHANGFLNFLKEYYSGNNPQFVFLKNAVQKISEN